MTERSRLKFRKLGIIVLCWIIAGMIMTFYEYFVLTSGLSAGVSPSFSLPDHLLLNVVAAFLGALMGGSFLVFYVNEKYRDKPYGFTLIAVLLSFVLVVSFITVVLALIAAPVQTGKSFTDPETKKAFISFLSNRLHAKNILGWSFIVMLTQVFLQFNTKFGEGNIWNMIRGKYQTPKTEERVFMFLDLNTSTSIAEKLGNEKYHELLKEFFADITNPILDNKGEIYQYVGDEVVIAWKHKDGISGNRCINCFFAMKNEISAKQDKYQMKYGLVPGFKAGLHCGKVVAGEVGIIKRDITFSGDVLNTTSRIQGKCKEFDTDIITSDTLLQSLSLDGNYQTRFLGSIQLRGKEAEVQLSTISPLK